MLSRSRKKFRDSVIAKCFRVLPLKDRPKIVVVAVLQIGLGFLDLLGVAAFGILGALAVTGIQSQVPGNRTSAILNFFSLSNYEFQLQIAIIGVSAALILILRTVLSVLITKRIYYFLARRSALISSNLSARLLSQSLLKVQAKSSQETLYSLTAGVEAITLGVLGIAVTILADVSLLIILMCGLFYVDKVIAISTLLFFGGLGAALYLALNKKAEKLGVDFSALNVKSNEKILEVLETYRESVVRNRRLYYVAKIQEHRLNLASLIAERQFMPNISKYVMESGIVIGGVVIAGLQFLFQDSRNAVASLSIFLVAGTRIAPAIMRLQQSAVTIKIGIGSAVPTLELLKSLDGVDAISKSNVEFSATHPGFQSKVNIDQISLTYPGKQFPALRNVSFSINEGESLAIVGPSGAGKTSLVDVLLGVVNPSSGNITISGENPLVAISTWPGAIAYVPQSVVIIDGTIRENIALGFPADVAQDEFFWEAIAIAQLTEFVVTLPHGLDTQVGESGNKLSGGQRQRLGIARAMFTRPKLLILDEATSSLDGQTEADISGAIQALSGSVTVVLIAHRLSTVQQANRVLYLEDGIARASGTFEEVRDLVPNFDRQAQLMGL
jgi:ABC-type multidrug transport system fused ATPase/permease subunit